MVSDATLLEVEPQVDRDGSDDDNDESIGTVTMSIEPPTEVTSTCTSTPHDIAKGLQDKPVQPCNHTFPKDRKSGRSAWFHKHTQQTNAQLTN